jgi:hypothetical protein
LWQNVACAAVVFLLHPSGGMYLEAGVETNIDNCNVTNNNASSGGGLCTYLPSDSNWQDLNYSRLQLYDLKLGLFVKASVFANNSGVDCNMAVGPYYNLQLEPTPDGLSAALTGVNWRKRLCGMGERLHKSGYCQQCQPHTYRLRGCAAKMLQVNATNAATECECEKPGDNLYAAGGAVIVAESYHWHP